MRDEILAHIQRLAASNGQAPGQKLFERIKLGRRDAPKSPADFVPWPFDDWRVEVLRRA